MLRDHLFHNVLHWIRILLHMQKNYKADRIRALWLKYFKNDKNNDVLSSGEKKMKEKSWVWCVWYWGNYSVIFVTNVPSMPLYCVVHSTADGSHVMVYWEKPGDCFLLKMTISAVVIHPADANYLSFLAFCVCSATNKPLRKKQ